MKATLGPWTARQNQWSRWEILGGRGVLAMLSTPDDPSSPPKDWRECAANARLVAAAPDLLAALQALAPHCDDVGMTGETEFERAWLAARAAIAKATESLEDSAT